MNVYVIEICWLEGNRTVVGVLPANNEDDRAKAIEFANQKRKDNPYGDDINISLWSLDGKKIDDDVYCLPSVFGR